ncbi:MAG: hypothetical protein COA59_16140 [Colwellia sp.]|nr:MAG: hypothetical protein COA59_16140 [Colwellia sp.]
MLLIPKVEADELRMAYLELHQLKQETFEVLWKIPSRGNNLRLGVYVELPEGSKNITSPHASSVNNVYSERWVFKIKGGLFGKNINILGLDKNKIDILVRIERLDGTTQINRLTPLNSSITIEASPSTFEVIYTYATLGVEHILAGVDHLLFVFALLLIVGQRWKVLLKTITAFTVAHSITLALATLNIVNFPAAPVEAVIALSIMFIAVEVIHTKAGRVGITTKAPWLVAFIFGLLHGFGFAGALAEIGIPQNAIPLSLLFFNVGVEFGQLLFIAVAVAVMTLLKRILSSNMEKLEILCSYIIGSFAMFWLIQRISIF